MSSEALHRETKSMWEWAGLRRCQIQDFQPGQFLDPAWVFKIRLPVCLSTSQNQSP